MGSRKRMERRSAYNQWRRGWRAGEIACCCVVPAHELEIFFPVFVNAFVSDFLHPLFSSPAVK